MKTRSAVIAATLVVACATAGSTASAAPGGNGNGNGNAYGYGYGNGRGGGGGAPLPALGVTLLGQLVGAGGLYAIWRSRRRKLSNGRDQA